MQPIATHSGTGWNHNVETAIYKNEEYTIIEVVDRNTRKEIKYRNVGMRNEDSAIQFEITEYANNRTKHFGFSIPPTLSELFIANLQNVKSGT